MRMFGFRRRRRARLRTQPLPETWWNIIDERVPYVQRLPRADRDELGGIIQVLLHEKRFEGCGGLEITDEIRVTIAAQAAVLLLHRDTDYYPGLKTILVYPDAYVAHTEEVQPDGTVIEGPQARLGESWLRGSVVLSWSDVVRGAHSPSDGHNVVFHEFAHQLDGETGSVEGAPALGAGGCYTQWAQVLSMEYNQLVVDVHRGHHRLIDPYGATSPAEFFAVITETFFEQSRALQHQHPQLYDELTRFYQQDPAALS